jgi:tetratricopeptide (TPR) repeat protein
MSEYDAVKVTIDILARSDLLDELEEFLHLFETKKLVPKNLLGYDLFFYGYNKAKKFRKSIEYGEKALEVSEDLQQQVAMNSNLGKVYLSANMPTKALKCFEFMMNNSEIPEEMLLDYSAALFACNKKQESYDIVKRLEENIWKFDSRTADSILFNKGVHLIADGDFKGGMDHLSIGRKLNVFGSYSNITDGLPQWDGKPNPGKHVLFVSEGGIGDEIINVRFVKNLVDMGMKVSILSNHPALPSYDHLPFVKKITQNQYKKSDYDMWTPMMDLPHTLNLDFKDLWNGPYLQAKPEYIEKFNSKITGKYKVGLRWSGNPRYDHELHRTIDLSKIVSSIPADKDWSLYSIQRDVGMEQLINNTQVMDLSNELKEFDDLLGAMHNLDLVITSCTSVAHAACAMGKKTIIMIPIMEYYTWAEGKPTSSFYGDNLRLVRQVTPETWQEAYDELKNIIKDIE